jgi:hypothetical protein
MENIDFITAVVVACWFIGGRKWFIKEMERNEQHEAPSEQQLRWHLAHMREDLHMLVMLNFVLVFAVLAMLFFKS